MKNRITKILLVATFAGLPASYGQLAPLSSEETHPLGVAFPATVTAAVSSLDESIGTTLIESAVLSPSNGGPAVDRAGIPWFIASPVTKPGSLLSMSVWLLSSDASPTAADALFPTPIVKGAPVATDDLMNRDLLGVSLARAAGYAAMPRW